MRVMGPSRDLYCWLRSTLPSPDLPPIGAGHRQLPSCRRDPERRHVTHGRPPRAPAPCERREAKIHGVAAGLFAGASGWAALSRTLPPATLEEGILGGGDVGGLRLFRAPVILEGQSDGRGPAISCASWEEVSALTREGLSRITAGLRLLAGGDRAKITCTSTLN